MKTDALKRGAFTGISAGIGTVTREMVRKRGNELAGETETVPQDAIREVVPQGSRRGDKGFRPATVIINDQGHYPGAGHVR